MRSGDRTAAATLAGSTRVAGDSAVEAEEIHIAGVLVQCRPLDLMRVSRSVDALDAAEVFQSSVEGKLVVVIEASASRDVLAVIDAIRALPGVLNVALVYQHAEPAAAMRQPMELPADGLQPGAPRQNGVQGRGSQPGGFQPLELRRIELQTQRPKEKA